MLYTTIHAYVENCSERNEREKERRERERVERDAHGNTMACEARVLFFGFLILVFAWKMLNPILKGVPRQPSN